MSDIDSLNIENAEEYLKQKRETRKESNTNQKLDDFINQIEFIPSPNFSSRNNKSIDMIVIHYTAAIRIGGTISWFENKESKVSAHYIIGRDGRTIQMVQDDKKAWHAGYSYWQNQYLLNVNSIGIELVGTKTSNFTDQQYESLFYLCAYLIKKYDISLSRIVGHEDISGEKAKPFLEKKNYPYPGKTDPGPLFSWEKLIFNLENILDDDKKILKEEPIIDEEDNEELYKPQKDIIDGKDKYDGSFIGILLDLMTSLISLLKKEK